MFKNKTVFVSGGTGYLGQGICRAFAGYGAKVIFSYGKNRKAAISLQKELKGSMPVQINLRDADDIEKKIEDVYEKTGKIDVLVNCAGVSSVMPLALLEEDDIDLMTDINVKAPILLTKAVVRGMIRNKGGAIVNLGSLAGERLLDVPVTYAATKASMGGFTFALATELKRFGIRANCVVPGLMEGGVASGVPAEHRKDFIAHCAAGRMGTEKDIGEAVCFLASDKAAYINGQKLFVDGGI